MSRSTRLYQEQLELPDIDLIEGSAQAFGNAFLRATQIACGNFEQIKLILGTANDFTQELVNLAALSLFAKMCRQYYSYVLLEIHRDRQSSQLLIEHVCEAAITLTYMLEEADQSLFSDYVAVAIAQASYLLIDIEAQLQQFPQHLDLLNLRQKLQDFINQQQNCANHDSSVVADPAIRFWGPPEANTTTKRGAIIGLDFLDNPARKIALKVEPASWLDIQLNYLNSSITPPNLKHPGIDFRQLRDTSHLCLHATQALLEEVLCYPSVNSSEIEPHQQSLNLLYEWFHQAYYVYQQQYIQLF